MTQPADLVKVDWVFTLGTSGGVEDSAEFGIWGQFNFTPANPTDWDAALGELAQYAADHWAADVPTTHYSNGAGLLHVRAARCDAAGHTLNEAIKTPATAWTGASSAHSLPWASTLSIGLYTYTPGTFIAHAQNRRGRIYLPPLNTDVLEDVKSGEVSITIANSFRDVIKGYLLEVLAHPLAESEQVWTPGVLSIVRKHQPGYTGEWHPVTHVRVDTKIDTQRRRERQQLAVSSFTPLS